MADEQRSFWTIITGSMPFQLDKSDVQKVVKGAFIACLGAIAAYLTDLSANNTLTTTQGIVLAAISSVAVNLIHKYIADTRKGIEK